MSNISIRVRLPEAPEEYVVKEERIILWDRILGVVFMGIIALAAVYFVFVFDWSASEEEALNLQDATNSELISAMSPEDEVDTLLENARELAAPRAAELKAADLNEKALTQMTAPAVQSAASKIAADSQPKQAKTVVNKPVEIIKQQAAELPVVSSKLAEKPQVNIEAAAPKQPVATSAAIKNLSTKNAEVNVHSLKVKSAIITREMKNRAPGAALADIVHVAESELLTVYFYAEFDGLAKQTLHFDWFQNGKRRARVKIRPLEENIGNYSSKYITHRMTGDWSVSVSTASGEKLASAEFKVVN